MSRKATIRTAHEDPELVARALRPDNTDEMATTVDEESGDVVTRIERETTGGLHSNVDDYVVNLEVATAVVDAAERTARATDGRGTASEPEHNHTDTNTNE
ncbi:KEOPS complex subunit Pcc1 [Halopiger xanaduensis]|uniref:KEOPS complex Pcc1-like subunit n=1 Tax=Halopiger xanaduensis (strain DSM 18323 / JCM 14033 / SH-6) TaxID=797210 RepID=F8D465_HALXS|nr:KEOPS complex subunit Pcc1 [Halopiger xanaduensis]AEH37464.1 hypothetical protein Halxa_2848 [Halopiger xanaduensis SH-6]